MGRVNIRIIPSFPLGATGLGWVARVERERKREREREKKRERK